MPKVSSATMGSLPPRSKDFRSASMTVLASGRPISRLASLRHSSGASWTCSGAICCLAAAAKCATAATFTSSLGATSVTP